MPKYSVRDAFETEVYTLTEISQRVLAEAPTYSDMEFDREKTANYIFGAIKKQPGWFLRVIADEHNNVVGGLLCYCETSLFGPDKLAYDITIMVDKEYRGRCLPQLLQVIGDYKDWATEEGAKVIKFGVSSGINIDKADSFFELQGFTRIGAMYGMKVGE